MHPSDAALARSRAYHLFGKLYLEGPTSALLPAVRAVPELAEALGPVFDADAAAADHHALFSLNVFPYASLFLDASGRLDGPVTDYVRRLFRQAGYAVNAPDESADHVGHALGALAFLTGAEADARRDDRPAEAERARRLQQRFLDTYLLWWLPALVQAVEQQGHPFYTPLGTLTLELAIDHRAALGDAVVEAPGLPEPPALLNDARTGFQEIARYLTTPAWSGLYLSQRDIGRLGRSERLPHGFGHRARLLATLLHSSVAFDRLEPVLQQLQDAVQTWQARYASLAARDVPALDVAAQTWRARLDATARMIDRIREAAARTEAPGSL